MLTAMIQSLLTPKYPRRYIGRHRAQSLTMPRSGALVPMPRRAE
jgi:hypothetical protein